TDLSDSAPSMQQTERARALGRLRRDATTGERALRAITLVNQTVTTLTDLGGAGPARAGRTIGTAVRAKLGGRPHCRAPRIWLVDQGHTPRLAEGSDDLPAQPGINERAVVDSVVRAHSGGYDDSVTQPLAGSRVVGQQQVLSVPLFFSMELLGVLLIFLDG